LWSATRALTSSLIGLSLLVIISIPTTHLEPLVLSHLPPFFNSWYKATTKWHVSSGYGLFRRMTGVAPLDDDDGSESQGWAGQVRRSGGGGGDGWWP